MCQIVGMIAAFSSLLAIGLGALSQILKNHKRKSCEGLSLWLASTAFFAFTSWTLYGMFKQDWFLIASQTPGVVAWLVILAQYKLYRR